jgi:hydroxymethylpyrimidine/phosphomethylpyrimidine kinase
VSTPRLLTIAGSDPSGGAGLQADLKTFHAYGGYGMAVVTALTAQNTVGVRGVHAPPASFVADQLEAVLDDCPPAAVKTGMLFSAEIVTAVADVLAARSAAPLVVDPVMVATSGDPLLQQDAVDAVRERLLPLAAVVTPNIPEAELLAGTTIVDREAAQEAAEALLGTGAGAVLVKGGHGREDSVHDVLCAPGAQPKWLSGPRFPVDAHGTGCTLSAAIAAGLGWGRELHEAVGDAWTFVHEGLRLAVPVGAGAVPLNHLEAPTRRPA